MHPTMKTIPNPRRSGQALIEVMVAVGILAVGFLGIVSLLSRALSLNRVVADNYIGTYLAAEGIELAKNVIDGNVLRGRAWNDGLADGDYEADQASTELAAYSGRALFFDPTSHLYSYSGTETTSFRRRITLTLIGQNEIKVMSEVTWIARGGGTSKVDLEDHFFNWR